MKIVMNEKKDYNYKNKFGYTDSQNEYIFQLKRRNRKWLWLFLLLPLLLLFVQCERDIEVKTIDSLSESCVSDVNVSIDYTAHYLYKNGRFFVNEDVHREIRTDYDGKGVFEDLPCSVFSYIFYAFSVSVFDAIADCYVLENDEKSFFHFTWSKMLEMCPKTNSLDLTVVDIETKEPLAGAMVLYEFELGGRLKRDSMQTSAIGICTVENVPECGIITLSRVSCYGYADTTDVCINIATALACPDSAKIELVPLKQCFSYFVKNKYTKEPIPGATVEVVLTSNKGTTLRGKSLTNVDGKGLGVYEDAFVLANVELKASKRHYKDGQLNKKYTVEQFAALSENERTVYLEPEPYMEQFQNVDSITGVPIVGVENEIRIMSITGQNTSFSEISNRNGIFYIKAMKGDRINIYSTFSPYYRPKETLVHSFSEGEIIKMQPIMVDLTFRTINGETGGLLEQCSLIVSSSKTNVNKPRYSGNGVFVVENLFMGETVSIVASKSGFTTNSDKVNNDEVWMLFNSSQSRRDIPLVLELPPCDAGEKGQNNVNAGTVSSPHSYNMGTNNGIFDIVYDTGTSCSDCIDIYNHQPGESPSQKNRIFSTGQIVTNGTNKISVSFSNGSIITVIVTTGPKDGSFWEYHISCPY